MVAAIYFSYVLYNLLFKTVTIILDTNDCHILDESLF